MTTITHEGHTIEINPETGLPVLPEGLAWEVTYIDSCVTDFEGRTNRLYGDYVTIVEPREVTRTRNRMAEGKNWLGRPKMISVDEEVTETYNHRVAVNPVVLGMDNDFKQVKKDIVRYAIILYVQYMRQTRAEANKTLLRGTYPPKSVNPS